MKEGPKLWNINVCAPTSPVASENNKMPRDHQSAAWLYGPPLKTSGAVQTNRKINDQQVRKWVRKAKICLWARPFPQVIQSIHVLTHVLHRPTDRKRSSSSIQAAWESKVRQTQVTWKMAKQTPNVWTVYTPRDSDLLKRKKQQTFFSIASFIGAFQFLNSSCCWATLTSSWSVHTAAVVRTQQILLAV